MLCATGAAFVAACLPKIEGAILCKTGTAIFAAPTGAEAKPPITSAPRADFGFSLPYGLSLSRSNSTRASYRGVPSSPLILSSINPGSPATSSENNNKAMAFTLSLKVAGPRRCLIFSLNAAASKPLASGCIVACGAGAANVCASSVGCSVFG